MADAGTIINARLKSLAAVTSIVGSGDSARIYPHESPPTNRVFPLIAYRLGNDDSGERYEAGQGDLVRDFVDIACVAETYAQARTLHAAVKAGLDGQSGTWGGTHVQGCFKEEGDETTNAAPGTERQFFIIESSYAIWYEAD